jgi:hypothetical protein
MNGPDVVAVWPERWVAKPCRRVWLAAGLVRPALYTAILTILWMRRAWPSWHRSSSARHPAAGASVASMEGADVPTARASGRLRPARPSLRPADEVGAGTLPGRAGSLPDDPVSLFLAG